MIQVMIAMQNGLDRGGCQISKTGFTVIYLSHGHCLPTFLEVCVCVCVCGGGGGGGIAVKYTLSEPPFLILATIYL